MGKSSGAHRRGFDIAAVPQAFEVSGVLGPRVNMQPHAQRMQGSPRFQCNNWRYKKPALAVNSTTLPSEKIEFLNMAVWRALHGNRDSCKNQLA